LCRYAQFTGWVREVCPDVWLLAAGVMVTEPPSSGALLSGAFLNCVF
jgi:hypothetical protein